MTDTTIRTPPGSEVPSEHGATRTDRVRALATTPGLMTWVGVVLIAVGAIVIAVGWAKSAGITEVGRQVPYLISAGFTGLGLVVVGVTIVNLTAKAQESLRRREQTDELGAVLASIRSRLEGDR